MRIIPATRCKYCKKQFYDREIAEQGNPYRKDIIACGNCFHEILDMWNRENSLQDFAEAYLVAKELTKNGR